MGKHKKAVGAAALSAVALAMLAGAQPAAAENTICTTICDPGGGGRGNLDPFSKFGADDPGRSDAVFQKVDAAPSTAFSKIDSLQKFDAFPGITLDVFLKYDSFSKFE